MEKEPKPTAMGKYHDIVRDFIPSIPLTSLLSHGVV